MKFKAHPLSILGNLKPILFILPLPYLRMAVIYFLSGKAGKLGFSAYFAIFAVVFWAIARYKTTYMYVSEKTIVAQRGVFARQTAKIPIKNIAFINVKQNLLDFAFSTGVLSIYTEGGSAKKADFEIKLKKAETAAVLKAIYKEAPAPTVRVKRKRLLITAAATSSAVGGLLIFVPATNRIGKLLGRALEESFYDKLAQFSEQGTKIFPPVINTLSVLLGVGFAVSFIYAVLRLFSMRVSVGENRCEVHFGLFVRTQKVFLASSVKSVVSKRPLTARFLETYSAGFDLGGGFDGTESLPLLSKTEHKKIFKQNTAFSAKTAILRPKQTVATRNRFLFVPTLLLLGVVALAVMTAVFFSKTGHAAVLFTAIIGGLVLYFALIRLYEYKTGRLLVLKTVHIRTCSGLCPKEICVPKELLGHMVITRLPPDLFKSTCRVRINVHSKSAPSATLRNIDYKTAQKNIEKTFNIE